ncbi:universal stress protein [Streptomyces cinnamoneus]|uniref:Universal stress protein n=1 Tax=Streptomyces cinnamoneus TaxID=53446 RepID=A0A918U2Q7_STRCJ|nr:universal stress protein [Streptomyces cinnamoneus]GHC68116.1 universal stress protein [Streptomyces cinnamoneus]
MEPAAITAGLDGSPESLAAAHWAAAEADRRGVALRLLHAWVLLIPEPEGVPAEKDQDYWAKRIVHAAQTEVHQRFPDLSIVEELVAEEPVTALLRAADDSAVVVLGSRGLDRFQSFFLGDIGLHVAGRAARPVVLVRAGASPAGDVVLAAGLHRPGEELYAFAFAAAAARAVPLRVVHGSPLPVQAYAPWGVDPEVAGALQQAAETELRAALRRWCAAYPEVTVAESVRMESPAHAVARAARGAGLLVCGRRRHHPALTPRLGAVVQAAIHHAPCPVAVVPHD